MLELKLPESVECDIYECKAVSKDIDEHAFLGRISMAEKELFSISEADLFIVNDAYRPTPTSDILDKLFKSGRIGKKASFLVATGCHQPPDNKQLQKIFGALYDRLKSRILLHDALDKSQLVFLGNDAEGNPVYINKAFHQADKTIVVGSVEPHYFAGFTGGRKAIFPGLCDYDTTVRNHCLAVSFDASPGKLEGNPIEKHLQQLMSLVSDKKVLSIQVVLNKENKMQAIFCGNITTSFKRACELSRKIHSIRADKFYDLLLAEVRPPLDSNLYQLQKSLENSQQAVANGGTILLFSPCLEGIGPDSFYRLADNWRKAADYPGQMANDFGVHKLSRVAQIAQRIDVRLYSELPDGIPDKVFFKNERKPQNKIQELIDINRSIKIALVRDAAHTVLRPH